MSTKGLLLKLALALGLLTPQLNSFTRSTQAGNVPCDHDLD